MENIPFSVSSAPLCPMCHQAVASEFYFCPNCGKSLREKPPSSTVFTQIWIYTFSIVLPFICFLAIRSWPAIQYVRSRDQKIKRIGIIAIILMALSTIFVIWTTYIFIVQLMQSLTGGIGGIDRGLGGF